MFLKTVMERNQPLVRLGIEWQQNGVILPDTYLLDYDTILENARSIKQAGDANGVQNFFMLKQIGRNPLIARALTDMGYVGAVCVDFREALTMVENQIPLGNVGHLVQIPRAALKKILRAKPVIVTVYTLEKAREISVVCTELGLHQKLMLRVLGEGDMLYSGQYGGFELQELDSAVRAIEAMPNVEVGGVCSFPCFLYDEAAQDILPMPNLRTVQTAAEMLRARGYRDLMLNTPSATCTHSIPMIAAAGGTHGEPGHGLLLHGQDVVQAVAQQVEAQHDQNHYGGGHYRRGHMKNALVGTTPENAKVVPVLPPDDSSIDYHFELQQNCPVSAAAVMAFRTQFFVTRSRVAVVKGLSSGKPELAGLYSALGEPVRE